MYPYSMQTGLTVLGVGQRQKSATYEWVSKHGRLVRVTSFIPLRRIFMKLHAPWC
jgi:hypothetical protein